MYRVVNVLDITERKIAEEKIHLQNIQLNELNASKDKFFSIIAHDLRSPFNGFLGLTKMLIDDMEDFSLIQIKDLLLKMEDSAKNLFALLENLLTWSRMQRGVIEFNPGSNFIFFVLNQTLKVLKETIIQKNIEIISLIPENLIVFADIEMLDSILRNLISNAIKFTPKNGKVVISCEELEKEVTILIRDNGIGMNPDMLSKLFKINQKVSRPGTEGESSTGLGLLLCREFIEKHGGKIWVESEVGNGSIFYFSIPKKKILSAT